MIAAAPFGAAADRVLAPGAPGGNKNNGARTAGPIRRGAVSPPDRKNMMKSALTLAVDPRFNRNG
jgi:hypothetical protein